MSWRRGKADEVRYRVTEPRQHPHGYTEYRVTVTIFSKKTADVKEITVYKRYSDFKKLHSELSYIHRNLFRKSEEFPAFPRAQVFGRFDEYVIEERRRCAEAMLQFTVNIPALCNSLQLKDFFKDGEVSRPLELGAPQDPCSLPAPLIPLPSEEGRTPGCFSSQSPECRRSSQPLTRSDGEVGVMAAKPEPHSVARQIHHSQDEPDPDHQQAEEVSCPFDSDPEDKHEGNRQRPGSPLSNHELAMFDPCAKDSVDSLPDLNQRSGLTALGDEQPKDLERRLLQLRVQPEDQFLLPATSHSDSLDSAEYLTAAATCIKEALAREASQEYAAAFTCYRNGVDILLKGVQVTQKDVSGAASWRISSGHLPVKCPRDG
ncbi:sorting nexin-15 isoform X2 [Stegostoma tigrinum]|uniref:sorting nexin-15 isoform X2 n=1 Tax=Stegostoma tigrinum TaxID=3053191 RepID=UPI00202B8AA3|nr:sorting nexin-15 isoform X2 [Stegostoma tigrinum]